ncbi:MAG: 50S ribosomal protein L20 [Phycisphaerales bacterium]
MRGRAQRVAHDRRRARKRDYRAALDHPHHGRLQDAAPVTAASFINGMQRAGVLLNRKMLSGLAIHDPATFDRLVEMAGSAVKKAA